MSNDAEITMYLYNNLRSDEEVKLKRMEDKVLKIMLKRNDDRRLIWTSNTTGDKRVIRLITLNNDVLWELLTSQVLEISEHALLSRIQDDLP
jgi:hypothetical protein